MKGELSSLDLYYLLKEIRQIEGSKIDKVFQKENKVIFQVHSSALGKKYLTVLLPGFVWITDKKEEFPEAENFAMSLRKHLTNSRITVIRQKEFERIIEIELDAKGDVFRIYIELFRPGNIVLCNSDGKVIIAKEYKGFGSRMIRPNISYDYPKKEFDLLALGPGDLTAAFEKTDKDSIVKTLAVDLGLGGQFSEELCTRAKVDKKKERPGKDDIEKLYNAIKEMMDNPSPSAYYDNDILADITPIEIEKYAGKRHMRLDSFNAGLCSYFDDYTLNSEKTKRMSKYENEKNKLMSIMKSQESQIIGLEKSALDAQSKGEFIYSNYTLVKNILDEIAKAKKSHSFKEIKERLKGHKLIKDLDEKEKKIVLEM
jgi:predicted ribosome quality control (RQC) complex YloA/Tae2 family protein